jgi:hypothetical protein
VAANDPHLSWSYYSGEQAVNTLSTTNAIGIYCYDLKLCNYNFKIKLNFKKLTILNPFPNMLDLKESAETGVQDI